MSDDDREIDSPEDLQRVVDEAVGEADARDDVVVGEPMSLSEFVEMMKEIKEAQDDA